MITSQYYVHPVYVINTQSHRPGKLYFPALFCDILLHQDSLVYYLNTFLKQNSDTFVIAKYPTLSGVLHNELLLALSCWLPFCKLDTFTGVVLG